MNNGNKIHITFTTTGGDLEGDFPSNQPLHALKREIMGRVKFDPNTADQFVVTFQGTVLDESKSLSDLGIASGSVLTIERKEVIKI